MLVPWLTSISGTTRLPLYQVGPYGAWGDLSINTRWGQGASGMYEAQWSMPLPPDFEHALLRRGTLVELMEGPYRVGSPLMLSEPARGTGLDDPWQFVATGIGREVEGENSFIALDGTGTSTTIPSTAVDQAVIRGWRVGGRDATVSTIGLGPSNTSEQINTVGSLLTAVADSSDTRWFVDSDNLVKFRADPTTPTYQVTPGVAALGTADDGFASVVWCRYQNAAGGLATTISFDQSMIDMFGRREYTVDLTGLGAIGTATAQGFGDSILSKVKGRLAWTNGLTVTSNEILTMGGVPADLSKVLEDVGDGCMVRIHGIWNDLLAYNGQTWLDIVIGEAKYTDGAQTIDLNPLGLAARDLSAIIEQVTGLGSDAA